MYLYICVLVTLYSNILKIDVSSYDQKHFVYITNTILVLLPQITFRSSLLIISIYWMLLFFSLILRGKYFYLKKFAFRCTHQAFLNTRFNDFNKNSYPKFLYICIDNQFKYHSLGLFKMGKMLWL
jgi:hypothetical protein